MPFLIPGITGILAIGFMVVFPMVFEGEELAQNLFYAVRFVLALFLFLSLYLHFTTKLNYEGDFQKIMYKGVILSLVYGCFTSIGFFINLGINPQDGVANYSAFSAWFIQMKEIVKVGLLYTIPIMIWIYFHPQNRVRNRKKAERAAKANK